MLSNESASYNQVWLFQTYGKKDQSVGSKGDLVDLGRAKSLGGEVQYKSGIDTPAIFLCFVQFVHFV
jgi:hypothetical protein